MRVPCPCAGPLSGFMIQTNRNSFGITPSNQVRLPQALPCRSSTRRRLRGGAAPYTRAHMHAAGAAGCCPSPPLLPSHVAARGAACSWQVLAIPAVAPGTTGHALAPMTWDPSKAVQGAASAELQVRGGGRGRGACA